MLLVADRDHRGGRPADSVVRRYRLARVRLEDRLPTDERFEHLRRQHD